MSHFLYKLTLPDGKSKSGQVTGKTEADARERLKKLYAFLGLQSIRPKPGTPTPPKASPPKPAISPSAKVASSVKGVLLKCKAVHLSGCRSLLAGDAARIPLACGLKSPASRLLQRRNRFEQHALKVSPAVTKPVSTKSTTKLEKLLFLQSNKCFFCGRVLTKAEASVEHLQPKSGGGNNADGNVVACCVSLNRSFGNISLKEKVKIIIDKAGNFTCPK